MLSAEKIATMMDEDGPIIQAVVLKEDGSMEQIEMDMSPRKNEVHDVLKGPATFIGQYHSIEVFILKNREPTKEMKQNVHKLPRPFHKESARGDILLIKMDEEAIPQSFKKEEFEAFIKACEENPPPSDNEEDTKEGSEEGEDNEAESEDDVNEDEAKVLEKIITDFAKKHSRIPTAEEIREILLQAESSGEEYEEEENDENESNKDKAEKQEENKETDTVEESNDEASKLEENVVKSIEVTNENAVVNAKPSSSVGEKRKAESEVEQAAPKKVVA